MGSFALLVLPAILILGHSERSYAREFEKITLVEQMNCGDTVVPLQSAALRTATIFGIRVYVVAYYSKEKFAASNPYEFRPPVCFEITYLRNFSDEDVDRAWEYQFKESSEFPYPKLKDDVNILKEYFGEIKGERKHVFALLEGHTDLWENGIKKGKIEGKEFQKNFLSIWFGKNPPTKEVKSNLLKGL